MDWSRLPPLAALRAFEAVARHKGFSAAARELNVTHAAVAQQVRSLEARLGMSLAQREGRGLGLTPAGQQLSAGLTAGFGQIAETVESIRADEVARPLRVSLTPSFAKRWLMPRLGRFWAEHPDCPIAFHPERRIIDLRQDRTDLAIRFGRGDWPDVTFDLLVSAPFAIVAAPSLVGAETEVSEAELHTLPWILEEDWDEQRAWMRAYGIDPAKVRATSFATGDLAAAAAIQGYGLHVESVALVEADVAKGHLRILRTGDQPGVGYYTVTRPGHDTPALRRFLRWIRKEAKSSEAR